MFAYCLASFDICSVLSSNSFNFWPLSIAAILALEISLPELIDFDCKCAMPAPGMCFAIAELALPAVSPKSSSLSHGFGPLAKSPVKKFFLGGSGIGILSVNTSPVISGS